MSPRKIEITSVEEAAAGARRLYDLRAEVKAIDPLSEGLREWFNEHPGEALTNEGYPPLVLERQGAGTDVDCSTMVEHDSTLLMELARRGALRVDWASVEKLIGSGQLVWPTQYGHRLYTMPKTRSVLKFLTT